MANRSPSALPVRKVATGTATGGIVTVLVWALKTYAAVDIPAEVAAALTTVLSFVVGYFTPPEG